MKIYFSYSFYIECKKTETSRLWTWCICWWFYCHRCVLIFWLLFSFVSSISGEAHINGSEYRSTTLINAMPLNQQEKYIRLKIHKYNKMTVSYCLFYCISQSKNMCASLWWMCFNGGRQTKWPSEMLLMHTQCNVLPTFFMFLVSKKE